MAQPRIGPRARGAGRGPRHGFARALALALGAVASVASAQPRERASLELATRVERIVAAEVGDAGGSRTQLVPVGVASPGDELVVTVTFANVSAEVIDAVRITQPIPPNMRYVDGSAIGPGTEVLYSVDGGSTYGQPNELKVAAADGTRRAATADDYTHVRWLLKAPLEAGARGFARFRAIVRAAPAANAAGRAGD